MKVHVSAALAIALLAAGTTTASAAGPPIERMTVRLDNEVSVVHGVHPCTGQHAELTIVESGVIHFIAKADGTVHFTGTLRGTFSADAEPADGPLTRPPGSSPRSEAAGCCSRRVEPPGGQSADSPSTAAAPTPTGPPSAGTRTAAPFSTPRARRSWTCSTRPQCARSQLPPESEPVPRARTHRGARDPKGSAAMGIRDAQDSALRATQKPAPGGRRGHRLLLASRCP